MRMILAAALIAAGAATAANAQDVDIGGDLFTTYCAACHGIEGRGDGGMAAILEVLPSDLTGLAARNDGVFPTISVVRQIDGRDPLLAHGGPMPLFGHFFEGDDTPMKAETGQPIMTSRTIADLVAWLKSIQE